MKVVAVIQARMSSKRFPGKVLHIVRGRPLLAYLVERLRHCHQLDDIIVATSTEASDDPVAEYVVNMGIHCYRGSLDDVAKRLLMASEALKANALVRISGDSPLIDSSLIDRLVAVFREADNSEVVTNVATRTFPKGQSVEVVSVSALRHRIDAGMTAAQKEHVTTCFYEQPEGVKLINIEHCQPLGDLQLSVDTEEDMAQFEDLLEVLGEPYWRHSLDRIIEASRLLQARRS